MNTATIAGIIIGTFGALLLGMAALIKTMVVGKLVELQVAMNEMKSEVHQIDIRLTRLETEHLTIHCQHRRGDD